MPRSTIAKRFLVEPRPCAAALDVTTCLHPEDH